MDFLSECQDRDVLVEETAVHVRSLNPSRVLEIGCGTGQLLLCIAPACQEYVGTEATPSALRVLVHTDLPRGVVLRQQDPADFAGIPEANFDTVILNGVVQRFPSVDYVRTVMKSAVRCLVPGGALFVGNVRVDKDDGLSLGPDFFQSLALQLPTISTLEVRLAVRRRRYDAILRIG